jgi:ribonuclease HII
MKNKSVAEIQELVAGCSSEELKKILPILFNDSRKTVHNLGKKIERRLKSEELEYERINRMKEIENRLREKGYKLIAGIDEAGRGPLSGPVVAAAVILPEDFHVPGIKDSKMLSPEKREELYELITENCVDYGIGMVDNNEIDRINIINATYKAVNIALGKLKKLPHCLILDAIRLPQCSLYQESIIKGDRKCLSIASASIVAKVERDRYMNRLHSRYPNYNFLSNKGYGTEEHIQAIKKYGPCPEHRKSFIKNFWGEEA